MSKIVVTDRHRTVRRVLEAWRQQTVRELPEIVSACNYSPPQARARQSHSERVATGGHVAGCVYRRCNPDGGEVVGYIVGAKPQAQERMDHYEIHKMTFTEHPA